MDKLKMQTPNITEQNIEQIAKLFPHVMTETQDENGNTQKAIDFDLLKQSLSSVLVEDADERYRLDWPGKKAALLKANTPITKTLRPCREDSVNFDTTENVYIEGDNFEVLKILQESYLGKVKMIYIDPPYNTGKDFIYKDNFTAKKADYEEELGMMDEDDNKLFKNTDTNGRFHSDWLSMMYERLIVARDLLKEDGVIFISIDDNEVHNLRKICDDIFGEEAFVGLFPWRSRTAKADVPYGVSNDIEWIVAYSKPEFLAGRLGERKYYESDDFESRWRLQDLTTNKSKEERPNSFFTMINPKNGDKYLSSEIRTWSVTEETFPNYYLQGKIVFPEDYSFLKLKKPAFRVFEKEDQAKALAKFGTDAVRMSISTYLPENEIGRTEHGSKEIRTLFQQQIFPYPKPSSLVRFFVNSLCDKNAITLDFFSGSATTAHAVMKLNAEDNGNRKFIMVQLPEATDEKSEAYKAGYKTIAEIGKERIRRAAKMINDELLIMNEKNNSSSNIHNSQLDTGFRVYKTDSSNMKEVYYHPEQLKQNDLFALESNIKEDRTPGDLLTQVILDLGLELNLPIEQKNMHGNSVFIVQTNALVACFDDNINIKIIDEIAQLKPFKVVFKDASFAASKDRINLEERFKRLSPETLITVI